MKCFVFYNVSFICYDEYLFCVKIWNVLNSFFVKFTWCRFLFSSIRYHWHFLPDSNLVFYFFWMNFLACLFSLSETFFGILVCSKLFCFETLAFKGSLFSFIRCKLIFFIYDIIHIFCRTFHYCFWWNFCFALVQYCFYFQYTILKSSHLLLSWKCCPSCHSFFFCFFFNHKILLDILKTVFETA